MNPKVGVVLLLLIAVCILSAYSCLEAIPAALTTIAQTEEILSYTYSFSMKYITDIQISVMHAEICFYTEPGQNEIVVQINGAAIEAAKEKNKIILQNEEETICKIDFYLPDRFYNILIEGDFLQINTVCEMHGTMKVNANYLTACFEDYCGGVFLSADEGSVQMENGILQKESHVKLTAKGNIYLNTKISDTTGVSAFYTEQGIIKIKTDFLNENTFFEVTAISEDGVYAPLEANQRNNSSCHKVQVSSPNGLVQFIN